MECSLSGFLPGEELALDLDVDLDYEDQLEDFRTIFFNNGLANNSTVTVDFSNGATLSQTLPEEPEAVLIDNFRRVLYRFVQGRPAGGFVGNLNFEARLRNVSQKPLEGLQIVIAELSEGKSLASENGAVDVGGLLSVARTDDYADGVLSPGESVSVPFKVCLDSRDPFRFFVNVLAVTE